MYKGTGSERGQLYIRLFLRALIFTGIIFLVTRGIPYAFSVLAPFFYAFVVAVILNPLVTKLSEKTGLPHRFVALIVVVFVISALLAAIGWLVYIAVSELILLANNLNDIWESMMETFAFLSSMIREFLDFLPGDTEVFYNNFVDNTYYWFNNAVGDFGNYLLTRAPEITTRVGVGVIGMIVFFLATYFVTAEYATLKDVMKKYSDGYVYKYFQMFKSSVKVAFGGYVKAQLILAGIAFVVVFIALLIVRQEYAFLIALLAALFDLVPLLGTATILVPWGILEILGGNLFYGVFLILLSLTFFFIRRIMEPKVMGTQTGLHPLVALSSIYAGWRIFGVLGAILGPILVMIALNLTKAKVFENTTIDIKEAVEDCKGILDKRR
ncbi:MAG: sporulation integral membrane protein YtvI [Defluviitaleaceae bacterium]|nr:sporulation integral membrane protein YtvI [Defluviitaleaceae bacterium]